jgi:hypothetical protein
MAVAQAYGKTVTSGSVFAYDVADFRNSYKGKPGYNVTGTPFPWVGNNNTSDFKTTTGTTTVNIPAIGTREVQYVDIWNTGASNCCPSLWRYGDWGITTGVAGNTLYTYSIIYKTKSGYTHPNFMYRYEYNGGSYITEVGVFDTAKRIDLGDGWYQAYNTFTTNASTNVMYLGMWYYQYNVYDTVYLYKASLTQGTHTFPPEQIIPPYTTRSATQGLLPLVGNSSLDLTNVSFDSNAQMTFDGTNDYVEFPSVTLSGDFTVTQVVNLSATANGPMSIGGGYYLNGSTYLGYMWFRNNNNEIRLAVNGEQTVIFSVADSLWVGKTIYYAVRRSGSTATLYINGAEIASGTVSTNNFDIRTIGYSYSTSYASLGTIPVTVLYNRALSAGEVRQNYLHYKTRFNLS